MDIQVEKLGLIEWISKINDSSVIEKIKALKSKYSDSKDWFETLKEEEIESINRGLSDFEN